MRLAGVQKLTLLDFPETVACTVFTTGCNFRCPFCHNAALIDGSASNDLSEDEVIDFLKKRSSVLEGVVITGGEPLIQNGIKDFLKKIRQLGYKIKLDTNGSQPKLLKELVRERLVDYVAMDIKDSPEGYSKAVGTDKISLDDICESKDFLLGGAVSYEFRTTVVKGIHTKESLVSAAKWISNAERYFLQQFKDNNCLNPDGLSAYSNEEMRELLAAVSPFVKTANLRGV